VGVTISLKLTCGRGKKDKKDKKSKKVKTYLPSFAFIPILKAP